MAGLAAAAALITASTWTEYPHSFQNPSQDPHRDGHRGGDSQRETVVLQRKESKGVANTGMLRATCPGAAAVPGEAPSHVRLLQMLHWLQRMKKAGDRAETPVEVGR